MFKFGTQNQPFFPENLVEKFRYVKEMGFDAFEIDGKLLVENIQEVKKAIAVSNLVVCSACGGYSGWIGDFDEKKRMKGIEEIKSILIALKEVGGNGIVVPAAWGMFTFRLPPMTSPRSLEEDRNVITKSLIELNEFANTIEMYMYLEPLNRYQDHMINLLSDARKYIVDNKFTNVKIIGDVYHMNIEEDNISDAFRSQQDLLGHVHIADNHRYQPGSGSIDFKTIFNTLKEIDYNGYVVYEGRVRGDNLEESYRDSIKYLRELL